MRRPLAFALLFVLSFGLLPSLAAAQVIGTFRWQLQPYCNVIVVTATVDGSAIRLQGYDDRCGAVQRAPVNGSAVVNSDGQVSFAIVVVTPDGRGNPTMASINLGTLGGPWTDSGGLNGTLVFGVPGPVAGTPRPSPMIATTLLADSSVTTVKIADGTVGAADVNAGQVQLRVSGVCPAGVFMTGVSPGGVPTCSTGQTGNANTALGASALASGSMAIQNTGIGFEALAASTGSLNTAVGMRARANGNAGSENVVIGALAAYVNAGSNNTVVGTSALGVNTTGFNNVAIGRSALYNNTFGAQNVAIGSGAMMNSLGSDTIAIGTNAGLNSTTGGTNIFIGNPGNATTPSESATIRIGTNGTHLRTWISGIRGVTTATMAMPVLVGTDGQLGTTSSSRRVKQDIADMGDASRAILSLRPVTFRYIEHAAKGDQTRQYGLIAEEVAELFPDLVVRDSQGAIETVQYHVLPAVLLNEVQRQQRELDAQRDAIKALERQIAALTAALERR